MNAEAKPGIQVKAFMKSSVTQIFFSEQEYDIEIELVRTGFILQQTKNENRVTDFQDEKNVKKN